MAKYKNREVRVVGELPHPNGDLVRIEHLEPGVSGTEIVPRNQVWVSDTEKKEIDKKRASDLEYTDFKVEGKDNAKEEHGSTDASVKKGKK